METKFNFKSQICTSREQSERLLALGLNPETADCCWALETTYDGEDVEWFCRIGTFTEEDADIAFYDYIPAWSLHRLIEMMPVDVSCDNVSEYFTIGKDFFVGQYVTYGQLFWKEGTSIYDNIINCIEWLIKEGYFNKEYLV